MTRALTDTLNKNELEPVDTSTRIFIHNEETGKDEPLDSIPVEDEVISETHPLWLICTCMLKGDTLRITSSASLFSGFDVITDITANSAIARYSEHASERELFKAKLTDEKATELTIPATISSLTVDRAIQKGIYEVYGKITVTTGDYYCYANAWGFEHDYIYKRMRLQLYFHCRNNPVEAP